LTILFQKRKNETYKKVRTGLTILLYEKSLKLHSLSEQDATVGKMMNLVSNDLTRIADLLVWDLRKILKIKHIKNFSTLRVITDKFKEVDSIFLLSKTFKNISLKNYFLLPDRSK
jgi:hypothetical protein